MDTKSLRNCHLISGCLSLVATIVTDIGPLWMHLERYFIKLRCHGNLRATLPPLGNKEFLLRDYSGIMVVDNPLIRPYVLGVAFGIVGGRLPLDSHDDLEDIWFRASTLCWTIDPSSTITLQFVAARYLNVDRQVRCSTKNK